MQRSNANGKRERPGSSSGKRTANEQANANAAKRIKIQRDKELFKETHGDSYNVQIFKKNHAKLSEEDLAKLKTDISVHQVVNELTINTTKAFYKVDARCYIIRVHTKEERLAIHRIITEVLPQYTTYCTLDTINLAKIKMRVPTDFPEILLDPNQLGKLVNQTIGNIVGSKVSSAQLNQPPCVVEEGRYCTKKLQLDIGIDFETYNELLKQQQLLPKPQKLTAYLLTFAATISVPPAFPTPKTQELSTVERTAIAAQNCIIAAKKAEKYCIDAALAANQNSISNLHMGDNSTGVDNEDDL